jgi:hypothetical protein
MAAVVMVAAATADLIARRILDERGEVRRRIIGFALPPVVVVPGPRLWWGRHGHRR